MERVNKIFNNILYKEYLNKLEAYEEKRSLFQIKESMENRGGSFHIDTMEKRGSTIYLVIPDTILC